MGLYYEERSGNREHADFMIGCQRAPRRLEKLSCQLGNQVSGADSLELSVLSALRYTLRNMPGLLRAATTDEVM